MRHSSVRAALWSGAAALVATSDCCGQVAPGAADSSREVYNLTVSELSSEPGADYAFHLLSLRIRQRIAGYSCDIAQCDMTPLSTGVWDHLPLKDRFKGLYSGSRAFDLWKRCADQELSPHERRAHKEVLLEAAFSMSVEIRRLFRETRGEHPTQLMQILDPNVVSLNNFWEGRDPDSILDPKMREIFVSAMKTRRENIFKRVFKAIADDLEMFYIMNLRGALEWIDRSDPADMHLVRRLSERYGFVLEDLLPEE